VTPAGVPPLETEAAFHEARAEWRAQSLPLAHVSIELGHLYFEDFAAGPEALRRQFDEVALWANAAREIEIRKLGGLTPRISTCFLLDDYFGPTSTPEEIIPMLLKAAEDSGLQIDYLARESACADAEGIPLADLVEQRIVVDPPPETNGSRPPVSEIGWLSNGQRSPSSRAGQAMGTTTAWAPPVQNAANRHSIFMDVELRSDGQRGHLWSCAYLASVWQLMRLGMLRYQGAAVATPRTLDQPLPASWTGLPAVTKLREDAAPFNAYRVLSILPKRFQLTEAAVSTVLTQVAVDSALTEQVVQRAAKEGLEIDPEPVKRVSYILM